LDGAELIQAQAYARPVIRSILKDYPDDVEDILQSAAVKAWQHQQDFHNQAKLDTWFTKIAIRDVLMMLRSVRGRAKQVRPRPVPIDDKIFSIRDPRPRQDMLLFSRERNENILKKSLDIRAGFT
jgi:DNA-directed RNA polymerase specialized sigma24 family protein